MGKRIQTEHAETRDQATRDAIEAHATDIRYYGMGEAFVYDILASLASRGPVDVRIEGHEAIA